MSVLNCSVDNFEPDESLAWGGTFMFMWLLVTSLGIVIWMSLSLKKNKDAAVSKVIIIGLGFNDIILTFTGLLLQLLIFWFGPCEYGMNYCNALAFFANQTQQASMILLTALAVERYCSIAKPFLYERLWSVQKALVIIIGVIIYTCIILAFPLIGINSFQRRVWCDFKWGDKTTSGSAFVWFIFAQGMICVAATVILNGLVIFEVKKMKKMTDSNNKLNVQVEFMIILVVKSVMFVIGISPILVRYAVHQLDLDQSFRADLIAKRFALVNSMVNTNLCWVVRLIIRSKFFTRLCFSKKVHPNVDISTNNRYTPDSSKSEDLKKTDSISVA